MFINRVYSRRRYIALWPFFGGRVPARGEDGAEIGGRVRVQQWMQQRMQMCLTGDGAAMRQCDDATSDVSEHG